MKKRIAALVLTTAMAVSLAACGGGSSNTTTAAAAPAAAETKAADAAAPAADSGVDTSKAAYTISIGHINAENDSWHLASLDFKEQVEKNQREYILREQMMNGNDPAASAERIEAAERTRMDIERDMDKNKALKRLFLEIAG